MSIDWDEVHRANERIERNLAAIRQLNDRREARERGISERQLRRERFTVIDGELS